MIHFPFYSRNVKPQLNNRFIILLLLLSNTTQAQSGLTKLNRIIDSYKLDTINLQYYPNLIDTFGRINYIKPIAKIIKNRETYIKHNSKSNYYNDLGILLTFVGDYKNAIMYYDSMSNIDVVKEKKISESEIKVLDNLKLKDIGILTKSMDTTRIFMINESHHKSLNRIFTYSILETAYKKGFRYFALETLSNPALENLNSKNFIVSSSSGGYTCDPSMAELIRFAIRLGFKIIPYEHFGDMIDREVMQAYNLSKVFTKDSKAKLIVHAGYSHIGKKEEDGMKPMAYFLRKFTNLSITSVDQEMFSEGSQRNITEKKYHFLINKHKPTHPSILYEDARPYLDSYTGYDFQVIHPHIDSIIDIRKNWLKFYSIHKKLVALKPSNNDVFLIQAYYSNELNSVKDIDKLIPADQNYDMDKNSYNLMLSRNQYLIVERDIEYKIIRKYSILVR